MSRYRVWEANRKVFLYPENWLEPELRDDQSPFFKETMSELLQSDITEDSAATALLNYLSKLEEVAKLEPCGIHYVENDPGTSDDIAHVVARTAGANRKYFYRRRECGYWTPWEQIKLDIEDNPVVPVVWKDRLFLFWLRILKEGPMTGEKPFTGADTSLASLNTSQIKTDKTKVTVKAVLCWSEYYNCKWQPTKTSDVNRATNLGDFDPAGQFAFDRSALRLSVTKGQGALRITISDQGRSSFLLYNTHSLPVRREDENVLMIPWSFGRERDMGTSSDTFTITYNKMVPVREGGWQVSTLTRPLLKNQIYDRTIEPRHYLQNVWDAPFFYEDSRHVFYVTTAEEIVQIPEWKNYGIAVKPGYKKKDTPPLVVKEDPRLQAGLDKRKDIPLSRDPGVVDPSPIERFVSEDAYIDTAIGTTGTVHYDEVEIGLTGRHNGIHRQ